MKYFHTTWSIKQLFEAYSAEKLRLSPHYQRNTVWSSSAQKELIETVFRNRPMPNFFFHEIDSGKFDMVDGQQRARTLLAFIRDQIDTPEGKFFSEISATNPSARNAFLEYPLNVTIITDLGDDEKIEAFYTLINTTGLRLNRPEVRKAEFYSTRALHLINTISGLELFKELNLFTRLSSARMNDIEFTAELIGRLLFGCSDKKDRIDAIFEKDISENQYEELFTEFCRILEIIKTGAKIVPISKTRYRQKNDFYTIFGFLCDHRELESSTWLVFYEILVRIGYYIRPSQDKCEPLLEYAINCVTQSNSKAARECRQKIIEELLLNQDRRENTTQANLLTYFKLTSSDMIQVQNYWTIDPKKIQDPDQHELGIALL